MSSLIRGGKAEATELAVAAGALTLEWFARPDLTVDAKADGSPVTAADRAAEAWLRETLARRHPDDAVMGEEMPDTGGTSGRTCAPSELRSTRSESRRTS